MITLNCTRWCIGCTSLIQLPMNCIFLDKILIIIFFFQMRNGARELAADGGLLAKSATRAKTHSCYHQINPGRRMTMTQAKANHCPQDFSHPSGQCRPTKVGKSGRNRLIVLKKDFVEQSNSLCLWSVRRIRTRTRRL